MREYRGSSSGSLWPMIKLFSWYFPQLKGLDVDNLFIYHIQVNKAQKQRRRTYRAHGRINRKWTVCRNMWCASFEVWLQGGFPNPLVDCCSCNVLTFLILLCTAYMSSPCHVEVILTEKEQAVKAEPVSPFLLVHLFKSLRLARSNYVQETKYQSCSEQHCIIRTRLESVWWKLQVFQEGTGIVFGASPFEMPVSIKYHICSCCSARLRST